MSGITCEEDTGAKKCPGSAATDPPSPARLCPVNPHQVQTETIQKRFITNSTLTKGLYFETRTL